MGESENIVLDRAGWLRNHVLDAAPDGLHTPNRSVRKVQVFVDLVHVSMNALELLWDKVTF